MSVQPHSSPTLWPDSLWDQSWTKNWQLNLIVLLVKEATTLFTYWEVSDLRKSLIGQHFHADWLHLPFFLQVHDVTDLIFNGQNSNTSLKLQVHPLADNWYIRDLLPSRRYLVDFGTTTLDGEFFTILRSNWVETPPLTSENRFQPSVRFGEVRRQLSGPVLAKQLSRAPQPQWEEQFDGYTLVEGKRGRK